MPAIARVAIYLFQKSGIGKVVNAFRKHDEPVGNAARLLVSKWKRFVQTAIEYENPDKTPDRDLAVIPNISPAAIVPNKPSSSTSASSKSSPPMATVPSIHLNSGDRASAPGRQTDVDKRSSGAMGASRGVEKSENRLDNGGARVPERREDEGQRRDHLAYVLFNHCQGFGVIPYFYNIV